MGASQPSTNQPRIVHIELDEETVKKLKVDELRHQLKMRGQSAVGKKAELIGRLLNAVKDKIPISVNAVPFRSRVKGKKDVAKSDVTKSELGKGFPATAKWKPLVHDSEKVDKPSNPTFKMARAPTIPEKDAVHVPAKYNFSKYKFAIPKFTGVKEIEKVRQKRKRGALPSRRQYEKVHTTEGYFKKKVITENCLTTKSLPYHFVDIFIPFKKNMQTSQGGVGGEKEWLSIELITKWTNTKAIMNGAGDTTYPGFKQFTREEIHRHIGLYILQGVTPSPQVELKFLSQSHDPIHGNDFVNNAFGCNAVKRHKQFKAFFALQNPCIQTPPREDFPNWKVRPLISWINYAGPLIYKPGRSVSVDEMTMRFKGKHRDKLRITYKKEGDGFQADALCDDGYTLQVHMQNDPAPKKYLKEGLSPLHARVMSLFDVLEEYYHQCAMDNLYNSVSFCRAAYNHKMKVLCHGVARKGS